MKINSINTINALGITNQNASKKSFHGLWGEESFSSYKMPPPPPNSVAGSGWAYDDIKKTYYPFCDESELMIKKNLESYNSTYEDSSQAITITHTAILGATLPILTREYKLFKEGKLSHDAAAIIERTIKSIVR